ncbi:MAG: VCBS repeat-containing protein [Gemmataceae bacterium]
MSPRRPRGGAAAPLSSRLAFRPRLLPLESREVPSTTATDTSGDPPAPPVETTPTPAVVAAPLVAVGSDTGYKPGVRVYDTSTGQVKFSFLAYEPTFKGGVRVATGDVNGDGVADIVTAPGPGRSPLIKVYDGTDGTLMTQFLAYSEKFTGGVYVAVGDVNGDGQADVITGAGEKGGPHVRVFNGAWIAPPSTTTVQQGTSSTSVAVNADGTTTEGPTTTSTTVVRDTTTQVLTEFMAYDVRFTGGVRVAAGDVNGDGKADIITGAGTGGGPHVRVISGADGSVLRNFMAFATPFTGGVYVSAGDLDGDGKAEVVVATGPKGGAQVRSFNGATGAQQREFSALSAPGSLGAKVAVVDYDQDGSTDILVAVGKQVQIRNGRTGKLKTTLNVTDANFAASGINI